MIIQKFLKKRKRKRIKRYIKKIYMRLCGTPGCIFKDQHSGACSVELKYANKHRIRKNCRRLHYVRETTHVNKNLRIIKCSNCNLPGHNIKTCPINICLKSNKNIHSAKMLSQIGVRFKAHTSLLKNHWFDNDDKYYIANYIIKDVPDDRSGNVVSGESPDDNTQFSFPAAVLVEHRTEVIWNKIQTKIYKQWETELMSKKHEHSISRAYEFMTKLTRTTLKPEHVILILDGNGENRKGMYDALKHYGDPDQSNWPRIITFDLNPNVVLCGQMLFNTPDIIFTGTDPSIKTRSLLGQGILLEHLISKENNILTSDMKAHVIAVYFDYCGGPPGNQDPKKCRENFKMNVFPFLPNLIMYMVTMSYRKHPMLKVKGIRHFIECPSGFLEGKKFTSNKKVLCQMFMAKSLCNMDIQDCREKLNKAHKDVEMLKRQLESYNNECTTDTHVINKSRKEMTCRICGRLRKGHAKIGCPNLKAN